RTYFVIVAYFAFFFFFQAEDGIRDFHVTGVQTCALPISASRRRAASSRQFSNAVPHAGPAPFPRRFRARVPRPLARHGRCGEAQIGRASCRERVEVSVRAVSVRKTRLLSSTLAGCAPDA